MLTWITIIFACQLAGETLVAVSGAPLPGPVAGMIILFIILAVKGKVPDNLGSVSGALLQNLSLLFVPAGVGIIVHLNLLGGDAVAVSVTLVVSTLATVAITGLLMQWLSRKTGGASK
jgi:putative effector of murein hydrolase LrgA (UPF0299 family)